MRVLVTGAGGFVAAHLVDFLQTEQPEVEVFGTERPQTSIARGPRGDVACVEADLNDPAAASKVVAEVAPDRIVHLAGQSSVHRSWIEPGGTLRVNVLGLVNLLDAVRERFASSPYVQHNHGIPDGIEGLLGTIEQLTRRFPDYTYDVRRITVDGDVVTFHSHVTMRAKHRGNERKGLNIIDSWRVVDGLIGDHWDAVQPLDLPMRLYALVTGGRVRNDNGTF